MAAPTPVSALVHSSTLVTAGVYLMVRLNYFIASFGALRFVLLLGAATILIAGASALGELDIKKIIALSTLRQLGLIVMVLGIGLPLISFFHLIIHAYFKAILFMAAGGVIHGIKEYQDTRLMGGRLVSLPVRVRLFLVADLSLMGAPFMAGFYSKDLILELIILTRLNIFIGLVAFVATLLTVLYSLRSLGYIFFSRANSDRGWNTGERGGALTKRIFILLLPSILGGLGTTWLISSQEYLVFIPF